MQSSCDSYLIDGAPYFIDAKVLNFIQRCSSELNLSNELVSDVLQLSSDQYNAFSSGEYQLDIAQFGNFLKQFDLTIESFLKNQIDFDVLRSAYCKHEQVLPKKYLVAARSKKVAVIHILDYIEKTYGWQVANQAMKTLQIPQNLRNDPLGDINVNLVQDLLKYFLRRGATNNDIWNIGVYSVSQGHHQNLIKNYQECKKPSTLYRYFFEEIVPQIDKNNHYRFLKLTEEYCVVESLEIPSLLDQLETRAIGGIERCIYRLSILEPFTDFLGLPRPKLFETHCVHKGDKSCRFKVDYSHASYDLKRSAYAS